MEATIALAGNPNSGKTTLLNELTGARQHVGNYPGVTVEKKEGTYSHRGTKISIVDLPGTYSMTAYPLEGIVARDFLVDEKPEVVVNIVDASNLERNLYLTVQFMEMGIPVCIALNMMDVAKTRGIRINAGKLSRLLAIPVIPTVARSGKGKKELMAAAADVIENSKTQLPLDISYGEDIDRALLEMETEINESNFSTDTYRPRWIALKYLEDDNQVKSLCRNSDPALAEKFEEKVNRLSAHLQATLDTYPEAVIADHRYGYIKSLIKQGVVKFSNDSRKTYVSDMIDMVATNRFAGPLIMMAVIFGLYHFTFTYSELPVSWFERFFVLLGETVETHMADGLLKSLIISGVIDGAGGVLGFVPLIMFMFFGISILEDSGYLARVAFMLDRIFRAFASD